MKTPEERWLGDIAAYASSDEAKRDYWHVKKADVLKAIREAIAEAREECLKVASWNRASSLEATQRCRGTIPLSNGRAIQDNIIEDLRALGETKADNRCPICDEPIREGLIHLNCTPKQFKTLEARVRELEEQTRVLIRTSTARLAALESWRDQVKK